MIYSKIHQYHHIEFNLDSFQQLQDCRFNDDDIFYHHHYHEQQHNIKIYDCIDEVHWEHMRKNISVKLFHENIAETFSHKFINQIDVVIKIRKIDPSQIYIGVMDQIHKEFLEQGLQKLGINTVKIYTNNYLLNKVKLATHWPDTAYKFSSLSRNYKANRLELYVNLLSRGCLKDFNYSFFNIHPYERTVFSEQVMLDDLKKANIPITQDIQRWIKDVPYSLNSIDNVYDKWGDATYDAILYADFHLGIETHYDLFYYVPSPDKVYHRWLAPSFITEKVYKAIACKKPFLLFSTPYILEDLRTMGFKTFSEFIDESYDTTVDNQHRQNLIVTEIARILSLPQDEYNHILVKCQDIVEYNYQLLKNKLNSNDKNFDFLKNVC